MQVGVEGFAADLTRYVVLAHDPAVRGVAADFWLHSAPYYRAVVDGVEALVEGDAPARGAFRALREEPTHRRRESALREALVALLAGGAEVPEGLRERVAEADREADIDYHPPVAEPVAAEPVGVARLRRGGSARPAPEAPRLLVVVPFRDRVGGARLRNLLACLSALRDQSLPEADYAVTVVEADAAPTHRDAIAPLVDHHVFVPQPGDFNKSWAVNAGVRHTAPGAWGLCLLDADILPDRAFLERNLDRLDAGGHGAHVGHRDMLCLDDASSDAAIERRVLRGEADLAVDASRGLLLHRVVGAAFWLRREVFARVGGMDERYVGWGGEDDDFAERVRVAAGVAGFDDLLIHLAHPRPQMERAGRPLNGHLTPLSWPAGAAFGALHAPVAW